MVSKVNRRWIMAGATAALAAPGVALADKTPDFPPPPDDRLQRAGDEAVSVDIYRMKDLTEQKLYFRTDLGRRGIEPVWIRVTNKTAGSRFLLNADDIVIAKDDVELTRAERSRSSITTNQGESTAVVGAALLAPPLLIVGAVMISEATEVRRNLAEKQMYSHTVGPGQSASGFVYVKTPAGSGDISGFQLKLRLRPLPSDGAPDDIIRTIL